MPASTGVPRYEYTILHPPKCATALVIPVLNENERILEQLQRIQVCAANVDVIVADGGSTDGSLDIDNLERLGVTALLTKQDIGKLSAQLRMAFSFCLEQGYESVITMDGNNKDGVEGIERLNHALNNGFDFVQGSRFVKGGEAIRTPVERLLAIRLIHAPLISLGAHHWYTDTTNGFRGHSRRLLSDRGMAIFREIFETYELLAYIPVEAARRGFKVSEVPVRREYPASGGVPTKITGIRTHFGLIRILFDATRRANSH